MPRFKGRSASACYYCHRQKIKCSGGQPCAKCRSGQRNCVFPSRDKVVTVSESYIRRLESELAQFRQPIRDNHRAVTHAGYPSAAPLTNASQSEALPNPLIENSTTEHFVRKVKGVYSASTQEIANVSPSEFDNTDAQSTTSNYTYIPLKSDDTQAKVLVKLPPHSYALYLIGQFESFMGSDYHWYQKKRFSAKIEAAYDASNSQIPDRTWLCCFCVVLALGESYNDSVAPSFLIDDSTGISADNTQSSDSEQITPPGIELFKQALLLFRPCYEEPTIEQVEALNLITFYCYSLNRRKTAYAYAGMALRLASLLELSKSKTSIQPLEQEHRKRIWWTTVCMDTMTCTELSLTPSHCLDYIRLEYPDNINLSSQEIQEFSDPQYLTAQIKLCRIKYHIIKAISELRFGNAIEAHAIIELCLQTLNDWRANFSPNLEFTEGGGFSEETLTLPPMRTIASLLLRYNQCYILLLRPLLLKQLHDLVHEKEASMPSNELTNLNTQCLQAAANNTAILFALSKCHKIAMFGFWESLHIFSSLTVHAIAKFLIENRPNAFASAHVDAPFSPVRTLLREMARVGNAASKDHERMIRDIEELFTTIPSNIEFTEGIDDLMQWPDYSDSEHMAFGSFPPFGWD